MSRKTGGFEVIVLSDANGNYYQMGSQSNTATYVSSTKPLGANNFTTDVVAVDGTATKIINSRKGNTGTGRISVTMYNTGSDTIYIGNGDGVAASNGFPFGGGASFSLDIAAEIYGVTTGNTVYVALLETY